jgi:hypothetical protein
MKIFKIILTILIVMTITTNAQTAADYYLPLCVGNYTKLHTTSTTNGYCDRSTKYTYIKTEKINGIPYFLEESWEGEYRPGECTDNKSPIFNYMWLRKDEAGNIMVGAFGTENQNGYLSSNLDSATILPEPMAIFPNSFLTVDSFISYQQSDTETGVDSVVSITATAGSYTNCIQIRSIQRNITSGKVTRITDSYYVYHVGLVRTNRTLDLNDELFDSYIIDYFANPVTGIENIFDNGNKFSVYPNPAIDIITLKINDRYNTDLTFNIYNAVGALVKSETLKENNRQINIRDLSNGIYMVEIKSKAWARKQKLIIQR